jgi:hypothetical protein
MWSNHSPASEVGRNRCVSRRWVRLTLIEREGWRRVEQAVAVPNDASAVVTMTTSHESHEVASKESSPDLRVDVGVSSVIITVEANGETATYNVTVTRASGTVAALTATALTGLSFWGGFGPLPLHRADGGSGFLDGAFEYSVAVPTQALSLTMARSYNASDVCGAAAADAEGVVICAQATAYRFVNLTYDHPLEYGNATVRLYVEAADHPTNATYTLYVFRPDAVLASLEVRRPARLPCERLWAAPPRPPVDSAWGCFEGAWGEYSSD